MFAPKYYNRMKQKAARIEVQSTCKLLSIPAWVGIVGFGSSLIFIVFMFLLKSKLFDDVTYHFGCSISKELTKMDHGVLAQHSPAWEENCKTITLYKIITLFMLTLSFVFLTVFCVAQYKFNKTEQVEIKRSRMNSKEHSDNIV